MDQESVVANARKEEFRKGLVLVTGMLTAPLYMVFWICDILYAPAFMFQFLAMRMASVACMLLLRFLVPRANRFSHFEAIGLIFTTLTALPISVMTVLTNGPSSHYYAGLNLVALGTMSFFPWRRRTIALVPVVIFTPYYLLNAIFFSQSFSSIGLPSFFITSTIIISVCIREFHDKLHAREVTAKCNLETELRDRERIIEQKSKEATAFQLLSTQFSPQVVHSIQTGSLDLGTGVARKRICAIFVDIENSTDRVARLDKDDLDVVVSMFMDDSIRTFLKHDITVDNFLGDCVLGFSNSPIPYDDYVERVLNAALELRDKVEGRKREYMKYWMAHFRLKIGIASGCANVGFYGKKEYFRRYTAIGTVMNKASRLCQYADGGQILVAGDTMRNVEKSGYKVHDLGFLKLKGFENDLVQVLRLDGSMEHEHGASEEPECPLGHGILFIDSDPSGILVFRCRTCGYVLSGDFSSLGPTSMTKAS